MQKNESKIKNPELRINVKRQFLTTRGMPFCYALILSALTKRP